MYMQIVHTYKIKHIFISLVCAGNTYGQGCKGTCGDCRKGVQCNHETGICLGGCAPGMFGEKCDKGGYLLNL